YPSEPAPFPFEPVPAASLLANYVASRWYCLRSFDEIPSLGFQAMNRPSVTSVCGAWPRGSGAAWWQSHALAEERGSERARRTRHLVSFTVPLSHRNGSLIRATPCLNQARHSGARASANLRCVITHEGISATTSRFRVRRSASPRNDDLGMTAMM